MSVPHGNGRHPELLAPGLRNHFVYCLYGDDGEVLYVGCTRRPEARWREHCSGSLRSKMARVNRKWMTGPYDYFTARRIEKVLIHKHRPCHNIYGGRTVEVPA